MSNGIDELVEIVARLRAPDGCPWDREQTHQSLCDCLIEEVSELLDTIDRGDYAHMREELGDLLLHVVMHAHMAEEQNHFDLEAVAREVNDKLIRRHPHVFGDADANGSDEVLHVWDAVKASEPKRGPEGVGHFKHLPPRIPALLYAREVYKEIQKKQLAQGNLLNRQSIERVGSALTSEEEAGRQLFESVAACKEAGLDPESALRRYTSQLMGSINENQDRAESDAE